MMKDGIPALMGLLGFVILSSDPPNCEVQIRNALIGFAMIGLAWAVWKIWDKLSQRKE